MHLWIKKGEWIKIITNIIINKLNLRPPLNIIEVEDVKKRLKLTEYIVFNNAKRKLMFEELGKNELYECVNSNKVNKYNNNFWELYILIYLLFNYIMY